MKWALHEARLKTGWLSAIALALTSACASTPGSGTLLSNASVSTAVVNDAILYAGSAQSILAIPLDGGAPQTLAPSAGGASLAASAADVFWIEANPNLGSTGSTVRAVPKTGGAVRIVAVDTIRGDNLHVQDDTLFWDSEDRAVHAAAAAGGQVRQLVSIPDAGCVLAGTDATQVYFFEYDVHTGEGFVDAIPPDGTGTAVRLAPGGQPLQEAFLPGALLWTDFHGNTRVVVRTDLVSGQTTDVGVWLPGINWMGVDTAGGYTSSSLCSDGEDGDAAGCASSLQDLSGRIIAASNSAAHGLALDATWVYWNVAGAGVYRVRR
ncbi:MAG TPA: hypothetical protein VGH20_16020 [Myxococcales bacterium]|jgi:hypothetical protein